VHLFGRSGREPESKTTANHNHLCTFTLAVERRWKDRSGEVKKETDWFNMEAWGKTADICEKYGQKGRLVFIEGQLRTQRYESNGETKYFTKTIIDNIQFLDWREEEPEMDVVEETE
jgi:single-strand DNA-binding protein